MSERKKLSPGIVGTTLSHWFRIYRDGVLVDLASLTITANSTKPDGTTFVVPTAAADSPQIDESKGRFSVTHSTTNLDTAGEWLLDIRIGPASGTVERVERYRFTVEAKDTHA